MPRLLIVVHAPSPNTRRLAEAVMDGARSVAEQLSVDLRSPFETDAEQVRAASGVIIGTTENFGYMSGALKDFFDRIYYDCIEHTQAMPYALYVKGGLDGTGARRSVEGIVSGLGWKAVQAPIVMKGDFQEAWLEPLNDLGAGMAAGLEAGIF